MNGLKKKEIQLIKKNKKTFFYPFIIFQSMDLESKITVSIPKKVGCACFRNKIRRRIKYYFKINKIKQNTLIIVKKTEDYEYSWINIQKTLNKFNIFTQKN